MKTREQLYAGAVYKRVEAFAQQSALQGDNLSKEQKKKHKTYGSMAHKLPVLIRTAGLAQAVAFVQARGKCEHNLVLTHLQEVLRETKALEPNQDLITYSRMAEIEEYIRLTNESLAALLWFKRFAQSVLHVEATDEDEEGEDDTTAKT